MTIEDILVHKDRLFAIIREAGAEILEVYNKVDIEVVDKADRTPVTEADRRAHDIIMERLKNITPEIPVISEEGTLPDYDIRKTWSMYWLLDPLDGTREFINRNGDFTVNLALIAEGKSVLGLVYIPVQEQLYFAAEGRGAILVKNDVTMSLKCDQYNASDEGLRIVVSRSHVSEETMDYIHRFEEPVVVQRGSSLKFLAIASADADIYPRMGRTMEWDTAAAQIVLEEAGGSVTDAVTGEALKYNKEDLANPYFIAKGMEQ